MCSRPKSAGAPLVADSLPRSFQSQTLHIRNKKASNLLQGTLHQLDTERSYNRRHWDLQMRILALRYRHHVVSVDSNTNKQDGKRSCRRQVLVETPREKPVTVDSPVPTTEVDRTSTGDYSVSSLSGRTAWAQRTPQSARVPPPSITLSPPAHSLTPCRHSKSALPSESTRGLSPGRLSLPKARSKTPLARTRSDPTSSKNLSHREQYDDIPKALRWSTNL